MKNIKDTVMEVRAKISEKREANRDKREKVAKIAKTCITIVTAGLALTDTIVLAKNGFFEANVKSEQVNDIIDDIKEAEEENGVTVEEIIES